MTHVGWFRGPHAGHETQFEKPWQTFRNSGRGYVDLVEWRQATAITYMQVLFWFIVITIPPTITRIITFVTTIIVPISIIGAELVHRPMHYSVRLECQPQHELAQMRAGEISRMIYLRDLPQSNNTTLIITTQLFLSRHPPYHSTVPIITPSPSSQLPHHNTLFIKTSSSPQRYI